MEIKYLEKKEIVFIMWLTLSLIPLLIIAQDNVQTTLEGLSVFLLTDLWY